MTVKEMKQQLEKYPDHLDVFLDERYSEFTYGLVNSCVQRKIDFYEDPYDEDPLSTDVPVVVLSEE